MLAAGRLGVLMLATPAAAFLPSARPSLPARSPRIRPAQLSEPEDTSEFNDKLYEHLGRRPEYETSEMYAELRKRTDVTDPIISELQGKLLSWREMLTDAPMPSPMQTPGEVIEIVLRALRDLDWPRPGHGVELLMRYSSDASILAGTGVEDGGVSAEMQGRLLDYFKSDSRYSVLLDWKGINYHKKLDLSTCKTRALQQLKLTSAAGETVPVTFQLSKHPTPAGKVWKIDQLLVKSVGEP